MCSLGQSLYLVLLYCMTSFLVQGTVILTVNAGFLATETFNSSGAVQVCSYMSTILSIGSIITGLLLLRDPVSRSNSHFQYANKWGKRERLVQWYTRPKDLKDQPLCPTFHIHWLCVGKSVQGYYYSRISLTREITQDDFLLERIFDVLLGF